MPSNDRDVSANTVESEILRATAGLHLSAFREHQLMSALRSELDWTALVRMALDHGTAALLCRHLLAVGSELLPGELKQAAILYLEDQRRSAVSAVQQLLAVLDALDRRGIRAVAFKGPTLSLQAYGDISLRGFRDLDLLIAEKDAQVAIEIIRTLGYRSQAERLNGAPLLSYYRYNGQDILYADNRIPVEPHWALAPRTFGLRFDAAGVLQRAVPLSLDGRTILTPSPEDILIIAAIHGGKEVWTRLIWVADVAEYIRNGAQLDWRSTMRTASHHGVLRMLLLGLALAERLLDAPLPPEVRDRITQDPTCEKLVAQLQSQFFDPTRQQPSVFQLTWFGWSLREQLGDRLRWIGRTLTTARIEHLEAVRLPVALSIGYPLVKVVHDYLALPLWRALKKLGLVHGRHGSESGWRL